MTITLLLTFSIFWLNFYASLGGFRRLSTKLPIRRKLFNNSSCSGSFELHFPAHFLHFHFHFHFPFPFQFLSFGFRPATDLVQLSNCCCCCFILFSTSVRWAVPTPVSLAEKKNENKNKKIQAGNALWTRKRERSSETNQFYDKAPFFSLFLALPKNIPNLNNKYLGRSGGGVCAKGISTFIAQDPGYLLSAGLDTLTYFFFLFFFILFPSDIKLCLQRNAIKSHLKLLLLLLHGPFPPTPSPGHRFSHAYRKGRRPSPQTPTPPQAHSFGSTFALNNI